MIGPVLTHLRDTLQDSVRMAFLHSSRATGRVPNSLRLAAEVHFIGHSAPSNEATILHFEVPQLGDAAAEWFHQQLLWDERPKPEQTAFELLAGTVGDI